MYKNVGLMIPLVNANLDRLFMLLIYARELWTLAKRSAIQFLLPYFVSMLSVMSLLIYIFITFAINFSF